MDERVGAFPRVWLAFVVVMEVMDHIACNTENQHWLEEQQRQLALIQFKPHILHNRCTAQREQLHARPPARCSSANSFNFVTCGGLAGGLAGGGLPIVRRSPATTRPQSHHNQLIQLEHGPYLQRPPIGPAPRTGIILYNPVQCLLVLHQLAKLHGISVWSGKVAMTHAGPY